MYFSPHRGEKKPIPEDLKDEKYFERRKRNNLAAKKSRDQRKVMISTTLTMMTITIVMMIDDRGDGSGGDGCGDSGDYDAFKMMVSDHQKVTDAADRAPIYFLYLLTLKGRDGLGADKAKETNLFVLSSSHCTPPQIAIPSMNAFSKKCDAFNWGLLYAIYPLCMMITMTVQQSIVSSKRKTPNKGCPSLPILQFFLILF